MFDPVISSFRVNSAKLPPNFGRLSPEDGPDLISYAIARKITEEFSDCPKPLIPGLPRMGRTVAAK